MDLPTNITIKEEIPIENAMEQVLEFNYNVKIEIQQNLDWCSENTSSVDEKNDSRSVCYEDLKEYCYQKCFMCFKLFPDNYSLVQHNLTHIIIPLKELELFQCDYCLVYYTAKTELTSHIRAKHEYETFGLPRNLAVHQCKVCLKSYKYKQWHAHVNNVHSAMKAKCQKCKMVFKCKRNLKRHNLYVHEGKCKPLKYAECSQCPKIFKSTDCLNHHIQNCHGESAECNICKSRLKSKSYLKTHMRRVHYNDGKVHKCPICSKPFRSPRYVNVHVKNAHTNRGNASNTKSVKCTKTGVESSLQVYLQEYRSVTTAIRE